jgi:ABC-2 type transport system permease protein
MAAEFFRRGILDHRRALIGWCLGIAAYVALIAAIFPSVQSSPDFDRLVESYPEALKALFGLQGGSITTGAGFLDVELFSLMLPLLVLVLAIGSGARAFAGEEDAGRLEVLLSYPVRRRDAILAKGAAVAAEVVVATAVAGLAIAVLDPLVGLELSKRNLLTACLSIAVLGVLFGWSALALGAALPSRAAAIGVPAGVAAASYLVGGLHSLAGWLDPFRYLSPFWLVGTAQLRNGADLASVLAILVVAALVLVAGAVLVERRDLESP